MSVRLPEPAIAASHSSASVRLVTANLSRYGVLTIEAAASLSDLDHANAAATLRSLVTQGLAHSAPLLGDVPYYRATQRPLAAPVLIQSLAMLASCLRTGMHRLTETEIERHWPGLFDGNRPARYYADDVQKPTRLGYLRVDVGGHGRWDRIVERVRQDIERHTIERCLAPLIAARQFEIAVVTPLAPKATRIAETLQATPDAARAHIRVLAMPELLSLIAPPPLP